MRSIVLLFATAVTFAITGCTQPTDPAATETSQDSEQEAGPDTFTMSVFKTIYDESDDTDGTESATFVDPSPDTIREQFDALDWENPLHANSVSLYRGRVNTPNHISLAIGGALNPRNVDEELQAQWSE